MMGQNVINFSANHNFNRIYIPSWQYLENPYRQNFCGEIYFQHKLPVDPGDFVHFRYGIDF